jgi:hypothetical protein
VGESGDIDVDVDVDVPVSAGGFDCGAARHGGFKSRAGNVGGGHRQPT